MVLDSEKILKKNRNSSHIALMTNFSWDMNVNFMYDFYNLLSNNKFVLKNYWHIFELEEAVSKINKYDYIVLNDNFISEVIEFTKHNPFKEYKLQKFKKFMDLSKEGERLVSSSHAVDKELES